jgi:photosystem II stability/assembly factor-like uncharacterized protein
MKRASIAVAAVAASLALAGCHSGPSSPPQAAPGAVKAETTTSSSTTTTRPNMTGTTRIPAARLSRSVLAADCPGAVALEGTQGSASRSSLQMVSAEKGFAADAHSVLVTDDGETWTSRYSGSEQMFSVDAVDADHAWAVGQNVVLSTTDGGRSWRPVSEPEQGMLRVVALVDAQSGWGATAGHLYRTTDGGMTWARADAPCGGEAVCFTGPDDGWAAEGPHVYRSTDGGDTWQAAFTVPSDGIDMPFNPQSIHVSQLQCARPGVAWVYFTAASSGSHVGYAAYRGTAAGQWTPVMKEAEAGPRAVSAPAGGSSPAPMSALGADAAMFLSFTPLASPPGGLRIREATDGGRRLGPSRPITGLFSATAVDFLSPDAGWVIGAKAGSTPIDAILATTDGGQTWREQYSYTIPPPAG